MDEGGGRMKNLSLIWKNVIKLLIVFFGGTFIAGLHKLLIMRILGGMCIGFLMCLLAQSIWPLFKRRKR